MRGRWFADDRDLVKWSALVKIAERAHIASILQVTYRRTDELPTVRVDDVTTPVDPRVWTFFRDLRKIEGLGREIGMKITVLEDEFDSRQRGRYEAKVRETIVRMRPGAVLLFLDPDTGLQPLTASGAHVTREDVTNLWNVLQGGDALVIYQHARRDTTWRSAVAAELSRLCDGARISCASSTDIGKDVALFFTHKP